MKKYRYFSVPISIARRRYVAVDSTPFDPDSLPPGWEERSVDTGEPVERSQTPSGVKVRG